MPFRFTLLYLSIMHLPTLLLPLMAEQRFFTYITLLLIFISIYASSSQAQASQNSTLNQDDKLNSSVFLASENGKFNLGFCSDKWSNYYLGIWLINDMDTGKHKVWMANQNTPMPANSDPVLYIDGQGILRISYNESDEGIKLSSSVKSTRNVTATLLDSGNFVLKEVNDDGSGGRILWQSFDFPTDTLLPGMKLGVNHKTSEKWSLISSLSSDVPADGAFSLEWDHSGQLIVKQRGFARWKSGKFSGNKFKFFNPFMGFDNYSFTIVSNNDEDYLTYTVWNSETNMYQSRSTKWVLDYQGHIYQEDNNVIARVDLCYGFNTDAGCQKWDQPACRSDKNKFDYKSGSFSGEPSLDSNMNLSISDCRDRCWKDCSCAGFSTLHSKGTGCMFWSKNLKFTADYSGVSDSSYILINEQELSNNGTQNEWIWSGTTVPVAIGLLIMGIICYMRKRKLEQQAAIAEEKASQENYLLDLVSGDKVHNSSERKKGTELKIFSFASIVEATDSFAEANKLGEGGFGPVYRGKLLEGQEIAVKRQSRGSKQGIMEFKNELVLIAELQHMNLVRLLGCCIKGDEKMIIYEYLPNKSLDSFLFDPIRREMLDWTKRLTIIEGIAQGLLYLHKYSRLRIIHRDLKASNILLDANMNPKISDFGLARIFEQNESKANTRRVVGTYGYMSPEYAMYGIFSVKSDVFSFGVIMLEIISGKKNTINFDPESSLNLVGYAWELWNNGDVSELVDPVLGNSCPKEHFQRCIQIGLLCVEENPIDRPIMSVVISMLNNVSVPLPMLKKPGFSAGRNCIGGDFRDRRTEKDSINEVTMSVMDGR
ncbi:Serine-threonine/tyrosine-protein kinase, catalytic domain [Dillenia turbinata]|uniref:Receptor-like serine/threonine-protein kinase n=1 Tax=Dillenia turbinata TaxID=194707 RepID=A0AAN8ZRF6_9MAGN